MLSSCGRSKDEVIRRKQGVSKRPEYVRAVKADSLIRDGLLFSPVIMSESPNLSASPDSVFFFSFSSSFFEQQPFDFTYSPRKDKRQTVSQVKEGGGDEITNSRLWGTLCFACKYKFRVTYGEFSPPASSLREGVEEEHV